MAPQHQKHQKIIEVDAHDEDLHASPGEPAEEREDRPAFDAAKLDLVIPQVSLAPGTSTAPHSPSLLSDLSSPTFSIAASLSPLSPMTDQSIFPRNKSIVFDLSAAHTAQPAADISRSDASEAYKTTLNDTNASATVAATVDGEPTHNIFTQESDAFREQVRKEIEEQIIREYNNKLAKQQQQQQKQEEVSPFSLGDVLPEIREGVESITHDSFSACFEQRPPEPWNFNPFLFLFWCCGVVLRYCIIFPFRFLFFLMFLSVYAVIFALLALLPESRQKTHWFRVAIRTFAQLWLISICAVVRYHGVPPVRRKNQIYVSNHTSLNDYVIMGAYRPFAAVGQKHEGFVGVMQRRVVAPLNNIFFERFETRDRRLVAERMKKHISNPENPPLFIFPEGVCVNNEYCVLFKKGVFELEDVEICPVAIRYNKLFSDPYWSSKDESFLTHIMRLQKSWCTVADVYFLEPQKLQPGENPIHFAGRVQKLIAERAGIKSLEWDGYLKYFQASDRLVKEKQRSIATRLKPSFEKLIGQPIEIVQQKRSRAADE